MKREGGLSLCHILLKHLFLLSICFLSVCSRSVRLPLNLQLFALIPTLCSNFRGNKDGTIMRHKITRISSQLDFLLTVTSKSYITDNNH